MAKTGSRCYARDSGGRLQSRLSHDALQSTLDAPHGTSLTERIRALSLVDLAGLAAFDASRDETAPIAPTLRLTLELAGRLRSSQVLQLVEVVPRSLAWDQGRALYDPVAWTYLATPPERGVLRQLVSQLLGLWAKDAPADAALDLWQMLVDAELESYMAYLLRRHQMEATWARGLVDRIAPEVTELCLAQRRSIAWTGIKEGAAAFLRFGGDPKQCIYVIESELRRQARWMLRHEPLASGWIPPTTWRQPLLLSKFLLACPLGQRYWTVAPSLTAVQATLR